MTWGRPSSPMAARLRLPPTAWRSGFFPCLSATMPILPGAFAGQSPPITPASSTPRGSQGLPVIQHTPPPLSPPYRCYSHAIEIKGDARLLIVSGLNGYLADGKTMPDSFIEQGDIIWTHLGAILQSAEMGYGDL